MLVFVTCPYFHYSKKTYYCLMLHILRVQKSISSNWTSCSEPWWSKAPSHQWKYLCGGCFLFYQPIKPDLTICIYPTYNYMTQNIQNRLPISWKCLSRSTRLRHKINSSQNKGKQVSVKQIKVRMFREISSGHTVVVFIALFYQKLLTSGSNLQCGLGNSDVWRHK